MAQRAIVPASVVGSLVFLSIMVVVARYLWTQTRSPKDQPNIVTEKSIDPMEKQSSLLSRARSIKLFSAPKKERGHWVPTLSGIIKGGDEGVFSSSLFNTQPNAPGELSLQDVYDAFANELRNRPVEERSTYPSEVIKFLASMKRVQRTRSVSSVSPPSSSPPRSPELPRRSSRKSVDLIRNSIDFAEMGLNRSRSSKRISGPNTLVPIINNVLFEAGGPQPAHTYWDQDVQHALNLEDHTAVPITGQELAALSVILGSPIDLGSGAQNEGGETLANTFKGALGISINATPKPDGTYHVALTSIQRSISQLPAKGSGYSTLLAKHLASGALPFALDRKATNSVLITNDTLEALQSGTEIELQPTSANTVGARFLASLPNSRSPNFHVFATSTTTDTSSVTRLVDAIGELPFIGGFTPLASIPLVKTVRFVASGGLVPGRLLQRLDALVEKVHRQAPHLQIFGPLYEDSNARLLFRSQERLAKLAVGTVTDEPLADKVARMNRYTTLLERLMVLVPGMKPHDVVVAVRNAMRSEMERSLESAVAAHLIGGNEIVSSPSPQSKRSSSISRRDTRRRSRHSSGTASPDGPSSTVSGRPSSTFPTQNLGLVVESVLKNRLPLDVPTIAMVARLVLVAWTLSVEGVAWEDGETGFRVPEVTKMPQKMYIW